MDLKSLFGPGNKPRDGTGSSTERMLLLSSGQSRRYRDDIIRVLALPAHGRLRFRYDRRHVPKDFSDYATSSGLAGRSNVLLAFLDTTHAETGLDIVPCRFGNIVATQTEGNFLVVSFEVLGFAARTGSCVLEPDAIDLVTSGRLPFWDQDTKDVSGEFCHIVRGDLGGFQDKQGDLAAWQRVVTYLQRRPDFSDCPFLYTITGLFEAANRERGVALAEGEYVLRPNRLHGIKMVHYTAQQAVLDEQERRGDSLIIANVDGDGIQQLTSQHPRVDSRYDVKTSYFRTFGKIEHQYAVLSLSRTVAGHTHHDFEIAVKVKRAWTSPALVIPLIGLFLASPGVVEQIGDEGLKNCQTILLSFTVDFAAGMIVAALILFGFRRTP